MWRIQQIVFVISVSVWAANAGKTTLFDCSNDFDCQPNSYCYGSDATIPGKCKCKDGFGMNRKQTTYECLKVQYVGDYCETNLQCQLSDSNDLAFCNDTLKTCVCHVGSYDNSGICYLKSKSYARCRRDKDCKENAFCFGNDDNKDGNCKCENGFELDRNATFYECFEPVKLKNNCERDIHCQVHAGTLAICNISKICECNPESHEFEGKCYKKAKLGDVCQIDANCYIEDGSITGANGFCVDGHCECNFYEKPSDDKTRCLPTKSLGQACDSDEECSLATPNARCFQICQCATDYTESRNESSCVKAATKFGDPCDFDGQCSKFLDKGICNEGKCGCISGSHGYGIQCVSSRKAGDRCDRSAQCVYLPELEKNVECQEGVCKCLFGEDGNGSCKIKKTASDNNSGVELTMNLFSVFVVVICQILLVKKYFQF